MAYEGPMYWTVIYKAIGDFGNLMRDAAEAKAALQGMQDAVKAESAAEVAGATQAASARQKDTQSIQQEAQALSQLANSAKATNTQLLYGGRNDMTQHLSDMAQELNYTTLLNRQKWLGFSSVQQAMSYRQQMYNLALLENKAHFAGYLTADQYLGFLQRETMQTAALSAAIRDRGAAISTETQLLLAHANALQGTHATAGSLGEGLSSVSAYSAALVGLPDTVVTRAVLDDSQALAQVAAYRAALLGLPRAEQMDIVSAATRLGGVPLTPQRAAVPDAGFAPADRVLAHPEAAGAAAALSAASDGSDALAESMSLLSGKAAVSADAIHQFQDSLMLAAVDARALEQGLGRLTAAEQLLGEVSQRATVRRGGKPLTQAQRAGNLADTYQLQDITRALRGGEISDAPHGYPLPAPGMAVVPPGQGGGEEDLWGALGKYTQGGKAGAQAGATLDKIAVQMEWLDHEDAKPRLELEGGQQAVTEASLLASEMAELDKRSRLNLGIGFEEVEQARMAADGLREGLDEVPREVDTLLVVDAGGAMREIRDYTADIDDIEREAGTRADFEDTEAESGLSRWMGALIEAIQRKYEFYAGFDDEAAKAELATWVRDLEEARAQENRITAGMGGASGGGGGGGPPPGAPPGSGEPGDDDEDLWNALNAAIGRTDESLRDYERGAEGLKGLPHPDDASAWEALGSAERDAGVRAADAVRQLQAMAQAAAESGKAADAARLAWAASTLQAAALRAQGTDAAEDVARLAELAASADKVRDSSRAAYTAQQLLATGLGGVADPAAKAAAALELDSQSATRMGWVIGLLRKDVTLWSGIFGDAKLIGQVALWHVALDGIIEVLALWVPALVTAAAGLLAFGAAGYKSAKEVYEQWTTLNTVGKALGTVIPPLTDGFQKLENAVRPQVYELFGDYLSAAGGKTSVFASLINQTGDYIDRFAAKIVVMMQSGGTGLQDFFATGAKDLALIGQGFDSLGTIIVKFIQATAITHIAEDLATAGDYILKIAADIVSIVPAPVLAVVLALHGLVLWGGLAFDVVGKVVIGIASLAGKFTALNAAALAVARGLNATDEQLVNITKSSAAVGAVSDAMGLKATEQELATLSVAVQNTGKSLSEFVTAAGPTSAARLEQFAGGLSSTGKETVALGIAAGATDGELASLSTRLSGVAADGEEAAAAVGSKGGGFLAGLGSLAPMLSNVYVDLGLLAAALIAVGVYLGLRADQTKQFTDAMGAAVQKASLLTVVSTTVSNLAEVTTTLSKAQQTGIGNASELAASQSDLSGKLQEELTHVGDVSKAYGVSFVGALSLLNAAGVTTNQLFTTQGNVWAVAMQQVKGLIAGYQAMGQQMGAVGSDLNALNLENSAQAASMDKLNQAYDAWTKTVAGGPNAFITLAQGAATFKTDAAAAGAAMTGLSAPSLTLQSDFQASYGNVESLFDAFRNTQALAGGGNFTAYVKDAVASLIPMAGNSKEAAAQISALAQEAGGPATDNIKTLQQWVGNIKDPLQQMYKATNDEAIAASNLSQDASRLTNTLQQELNPAMATAIFNAHGGQKVFADWETALAKSGPTGKATAAATKSVVTELLAVSGNTASAKANFVGFAEASGLTAKQADQLWDQASKHITANLGAVRKQLASTATEQSNLAKPGEVDTILKSFKDGTFYELTFLAWIPQVQRALNVVNHDVGQFFAHDIPVAFGVTSHAFMAAWNGMVNWFSNSVPHAFGTAWNNTWRDVAAPVVRAFGDVTSWVARNFDPWWATHGAALEKIWSTVWGFMTTAAEDTFRAVKAGATEFWSFITGLFDNNATRFIWKNFQQSAAQAWQWIKTAASATWSVITQGADAFFGFVEKGAKTAADVLAFAFKGAWATVVALAKIAWDTIVVIVDLALDLVTGHWHQAWEDIKAYGIQVFNALKAFFGTTFQAIATLAVQLWHIWFGPAAAQFNANVAQPLNKFFTGTVPGWFNSITRWWSNLWNANIKSFDGSVLAPLQKFFTGTIPGWWNSLASAATKTWAAVWSGFSKTVLSPLQSFFTGTVPKWWDSFTAAASKAWSNTWAGFQHNVLAPIENFFTSTLPSAMWNSLKGGIDHVISGLNTVIGWINAVTSIVGVHIGTISMLAGGGPVRMAHGSVPGTGDEDGTHIVAMGGEYMVRKPARMALQAAYGPDVMDHLNQADTWLGSGSRGNTASQRGSGRGRYASGGGIISDIGNFLGDAGSAIASGAGAVWNGIAGAAADVAKFGEQAAFNAMWTTAGVPAQKAMEALGTPGDMGASWLQDVHNGVSTWIAGQTAKATAAAAAAGGPGGPTGSDSANAAEGYRYLLGSLFGGSKIGAAGAVASIDGESNWNPFAQGTGGRGLIGWTPPGTISDAAFSGGMRTQLPAIIQFVNSSGDMGAVASMRQQTSLNTSAQIWGQRVERYGINDVHPAGLAMAAAIAGIPNNAAGGIVGYAGGGPVMAAVTAATADPDTRDAMALGSWLLTRLNAAGTAPSYGEYGAWLLSLAKNKGLTKAQAQSATTAARLVEPAYAKGARASTASSWKATPSTAALHAYALASTSLGTHWSTPSAGTLASGWAAVQDFLGPAPGQSTSAAPSGDVAAYAADAAKLYPAWEGALGPWHTLAALKQPKSTSAANWKAWLAQRAVVQDRVNTASSYIAPLFTDLKANPQELTAADWSLADSSVRRLQAAMDVAAWAKSAENQYYSPIQSNLAKLEPDIIAAANAWHGIWGTTLTPVPGGGTSGTGGGSGSGTGGVGTPGAGSAPGGTGGATVIDLNKLIVGGPASPAVGNMGFGIASGGGVPTLSGVAAMFGGGMASGGVVPNLFVPGLSANLSRQLSAATSGQLPRTLSAAAGNRVGLQVDQLTINNPKAERPSDSITRASNRLAFLGGRGMV